MDDHFLARRASTGLVRVYRMTTQKKYRPRLIGTFAGSTMAVGGTWSPSST